MSLSQGAAAAAEGPEVGAGVEAPKDPKEAAICGACGHLWPFAALAAPGDDGLAGSPKIKRKKTVEQTYQKKTQVRALQGSAGRSAFELI